MAGLKESLTKGLTTINVKTSTFMEVSKHKTHITSLENEISMLEQNLGKSIYEKWKSGTDYKEGIEEVLSTIQSKYDLIEEQRHTIEKIQEEEKQILGKQQSADPSKNASTVFCSRCGAPNAAAHKFCCKCGNPLNQPDVLQSNNGMTEYKPFKEGKVREVYDNGDNLIMVATDRISAFDVILKNKVTDKGAILTQMSKFWFDFTSDVVANHMISVDPQDMPEFFRQERFCGNSMMVKKLNMIPIECIVRGYITGSGWASYKENGTVCGITLPEGLVESDKLPEPIYTPSTKADLGDHDENISFEQSVEVLEKHFPGKGQEYAEKIRDYTIALYKKCAEYALSKGIIIADTKFEFGLDEAGNVVLGDEMLTPDSSRFWPLEGYKPGQSQPSFDKQFVRDWLKANPDSDYLLPDDVIAKTVAKYKEAYALLTGKEFTR